MHNIIGKWKSFSPINLSVKSSRNKDGYLYIYDFGADDTLNVIIDGIKAYTAQYQYIETPDEVYRLTIYDGECREDYTVKHISKMAIQLYNTSSCNPVVIIRK